MKRNLEKIMSSEINLTEIGPVFQTRLSIESRTVLSKCEESLVSRVSPMTNNNQRLLPGLPSSGVSTTCNSNNNSNPSSSSLKLGSRRIFTPQFKLQVLESYRSDSDCKGNQRATARKYNIHRRQIQKWLQCESNLRSSVANINQNSVKHQFHNMSPNHLHHRQQLQTHSSTYLLPTRMTIKTIVPSVSQNKANIGYSYHQHTHPRLPSDATCQTLTLNSLNVPSMSNITTTKGDLAANLATAVAVAIVSSSSPSTSIGSPLRPTAISGAVGASARNNTVSTISSSILHSHQHHHHFQISPFTGAHVGAPVPISVAILPQHLHYPYNNLSPHTYPHPLPLSHQTSAFMPTTTCLPVNVLSTVADTSRSGKETDTTAGMEEQEIEYNAKMCERTQDQKNTATNKSTITLQQTKTTDITIPTAEELTGGTSHSNMNDIEYECVYKGAMFTNGDNIIDVKCKTAFEPMPYRYKKKDNLQTLTPSPMDLSLRSRKKSFCGLKIDTQLPRSPTRMNEFNFNMPVYCSLDAKDETTNKNIDTDIVDLTFRKRKAVTARSGHEQPKKLAKCLNHSFADNQGSFKQGLLTNIANNELKHCDEDVEIEIQADVDAKHVSSKPIKLFKPYLLDDFVDVNENSKPNGEREPIIWSNHPALSNEASRASGFYSPTADNHTFPNGYSLFLASKTSGPQCVINSPSASLVSPTSFFRYPKGSPVSGYESSSSTCSEREDTYSASENQSYRLDFKMQSVYQEKLNTLHKPIHIHEWLREGADVDKKVARASIALYA